MNENIDLYEILKDCPAGTKLYTPLAGDVYFEGVNNNVDAYFIEVKPDDMCSMFFDKKGRIDAHYKNAECLLFPSKDQRDWSKFKCLKLRFDPNTLKPFDKVLVNYYLNDRWEVGLFSHSVIMHGVQGFIVNSSYRKYVIPYNDDTKHLVGTKDQAPEYYRYWED